jgi:hypothetical protein
MRFVQDFGGQRISTHLSWWKRFRAFAPSPQALANTADLGGEPTVRGSSMGETLRPPPRNPGAKVRTPGTQRNKLINAETSCSGVDLTLSSSKNLEADLRQRIAEQLSLNNSLRGEGCSWLLRSMPSVGAEDLRYLGRQSHHPGRRALAALLSCASTALHRDNQLVDPETMKQTLSQATQRAQPATTGARATSARTARGDRLLTAFRAEATFTSLLLFDKAHNPVSPPRHQRRRR